MPVVCAACGTENREAAKFCRGCGARLAGAAPAATGDESVWPTTQPSDLGGATADERTVILGAPAAASRPAPPPPAPPPLAAVPSPPARPPAPVNPMPTAAPASKGPWIAVGAVALLLVVGAGAFWALRGTGNAARPAPAPAAAPAAAPAPLPPVAPAAEPAAPPAAPAPEPAPPPPEPAPAPPPAPAPAPAVAPPPAKPRPKKEAPAPVAPKPPVEVPVAAPVAPPPPPPPAPTPEAVCAGRNFIARAQCLAAECAKPAQRAHPQCEAVRQQQRLEEEKRNPTLAN